MDQGNVGRSHRDVDDAEKLSLEHQEKVQGVGHKKFGMRSSSTWVGPELSVLRGTVTKVENRIRELELENSSLQDLYKTAVCDCEVKTALLEFSKGVNNVVIGTRASNLAVWQANKSAELIRAEWPGVQCTIEKIITTGDKDQNTPLTKFSDKGIFTKELDRALIQKRIQLAVHCVKDLPTIVPPGLKIGAILERGEREDCVLFHPKYAKGTKLESLPVGSLIGTSSVRRTGFLSRLYPHLVVKGIRGNLNTRLRKLDSGDYDAIILAEVGVKRLGWHDRVGEVLNPATFPYCVGQGALAVLIRDPQSSEDKAIEELVASLNHFTSCWDCEAERSLLRELEGGCKVPIGCAVNHGELGKVEMKATVLSPDGKKYVEAKEQTSQDGGLEAARELGSRVAKGLLERGAKEILDALKEQAK